MKQRVLYVTLFIFCLSTTSDVSGQSLSKRNTIYVELLGNGLLTSINYEGQLLKETRLNFHIGTGIYGGQSTYLTIPLGLHYLIKVSKAESYIDLGFGATYSKADVSLYAIVEHRDPNYKNTDYWNYIPSIGYRKITKKNLMYRFSITPVLNHHISLPYFGFSFGKSF